VLVDQQLRGAEYVGVVDHRAAERLAWGAPSFSRRQLVIHRRLMLFFPEMQSRPRHRPGSYFALMVRDP
jgi:hypothetical protein